MRDVNTRPYKYIALYVASSTKTVLFEAVSDDRLHFFLLFCTDNTKILLLLGKCLFLFWVKQINHSDKCITLQTMYWDQVNTILLLLLSNR